MNKTFLEEKFQKYGKVGLYDAENRSWFRIDSLDINNDRFDRLICSQVTPENIDVFLLPGFVDAHCHILENPYDEHRDLVSIAYINTLVAANHGITSVKDMGGYGYKTLEISHILSKYDLARIFTAGCYFTVPSGHCSERGAIEVSNIDDFKNGMKTLLYNEVKYCKIINSDDGFEYELLCQMIEYAHHYRMIVSTHAYTEKAAYEAVMAGTDILEHAGDYSNDLLDLIKEKDIIIIPTYVAASDSTPENCEGLKDVDKTVLSQWLYGENAVIPKLFEKDIKVGLGTDAGFPGTPFDSLLREIELLNTRFDIAIEDILYSAYVVTPQALGASEIIGKIKNGYLADCLVYFRNPLSGLDELKNPDQVWIAGRRIDNRAGNYVKIKRLEINHIPLISDNLRNYYFDCAELDDFWNEQELAAWISTNEDYCIGAFADNQLVGFCLTHYHMAVNKVHLENIYVCEKYRKQGVAKRLLFDIIAHYRELSKNKIRFVGLVDESNEAALSILENANFVKGHPMNWMQLNSYENY